MGLTRRQVILCQAMLICIVVVGGIFAYWSIANKEDHIEMTYEYTYSGMKPAGILVDDDGREVIRMSTWAGDTSTLYTTWGTSGQYAPTPTQDAQWIQYTIRIHADPGTTVTSEQVSIHVKPGLIIIDESGFDPSKYHTSAHMMYNGKRVHSSLSNTSVTTDSSGYAEMILVILTDQWHRHVEIDGDWTYLESST